VLTSSSSLESELESLILSSQIHVVIGTDVVLSSDESELDIDNEAHGSFSLLSLLSLLNKRRRL